jgi:hypothetical protein
MEEIIVRSSPSSTWVAANCLARSTSCPKSTVSSNGELNRLSDGDRPYPAIQSAYSDALMPSGTSALTAVNPMSWKSRNASSNASRVLPAVLQYGIGLAAILPGFVMRCGEAASAALLTTDSPAVRSGPTRTRR